jgi:enoyl-CoA hydratase
MATPDATDALLVDKAEHVVTITMNRPSAMNALNLEMLARMADAWAMVDADDEVRVAVLTGAGGNFSTGSDLKAMFGDLSGNPWQARFKEDPDLHWRAFLRHHRPKKPVIAAVEGYAVAGGCEILQGTDIRVAGRSAKFGIAEARWGLFPLGGSTVRLRRQIPYTLAAEMLLTGKNVGAEEAARIGLIGRVVEDGQALLVAKEIAAQIAANGPLAVQAILRSLRETEGLTEAEALKKELEIGQAVFKSEDAKEGPKAFAEKRKPVFKGR